MDVSVAAVADGEWELLDRLLQLYLHDFSPMTGDDVDEDGRYAYRWLPAYLTDGGREALLVRVDGAPAGFVLIRLGDPTQIAEFFIVRRHRRSGIGIVAARAAFSRHPGRWSVTELPENAAATAFWRHAIPVPFAEQTTDAGRIEQTFVIPAR